jgi:GTP-binding protein
MFVDELTIGAQAGRGGDGVVRWRHEKFVDRGGPAGGNGGRGGNVYFRAVRDLGLLAKYTGAKEFKAENGAPGARQSKRGKDGEDLYIDVPVGSTITEHERERIYRLSVEGETCKVLRGGLGGFGNEHFKSSTNRSPQEATKGKKGERGTFTIELSLLVDVGIIGFPNAGKSTLINALTHARSRIGAYPFTTTEPHLGDLFGYILADIPGLIAGASAGKGLGHKFLRHVERTRMLLHCVSLEGDDVKTRYETIRTELERFNPALLEKEEWAVLTKSDLATAERLSEAKAYFTSRKISYAVISAEKGEGVKSLSETLVAHLKNSTKTGE